MHGGTHVIAANFDSRDALWETTQYVALSEALFGLSDLSPLSSPDSTPPPSPILQSRLDLDATEESGHSTSGISGLTPPLTPRPTLPTTAANAKERKHAKKRAKNHLNRKTKREQARDATFANIKARPTLSTKILNSHQPIVCETETSKASRVSTGYTGKNDEAQSRSLFTLEELVGEGSKWGFKLEKWDGR